MHRRLLGRAEKAFCAELRAHGVWTWEAPGLRGGAVNPRQGVSSPPGAGVA